MKWNHHIAIVQKCSNYGKKEKRSVHLFARRDVRKPTSLTAKFQEDPIEPLREIAWRSYGI